MAQTRYWSYKADDATKDLIRWFNGIIPSGRYFGFDFAPSADLNLVLDHLTTGFSDVDDTETERLNQSKVMTRQGMTIVEDASVTLNGISVGDVTNDRIDVVILTHEYTVSAGGQQALYSIIEGTPAGSPVAPSLSDPLRQVKIGELLVPPNMTDLTDVGVVWTQEPAPSYSSSSLTGDRAVITNSLGKLAVSITTAAELAFVNGVTSSVQDQINTKQANLTGATSALTATDLTVSRATESDGSGKLISSVITAVELGYLNNASSEIQAQINTKQATLTGATSALTSSNLTASRATETDGGGKLIASTITATELGYLNNASSEIQAQINTKQATITGGASTIASSNLATNRALISDGSGKVAVSAVTATELGYLDTVSSNIQTQLGLKLEDTDAVLNITNTGSFTQLKTVIVEIGDWNMDTDQAKVIDIGIPRSKIRGIQVMIISDTDASIETFEDLTRATTINNDPGGQWQFIGDDTTTDISLARTVGEQFDSTDYNETPFNRGFIYVLHED